MGDRSESRATSFLYLFCALSLVAACSSISPVNSREGLSSPRGPASSSDAQRFHQPPVSPDAGTETEVFRAAARDRLKGSYYRAQLPCADFWARGGQQIHVVVDMPPWAAAGGLLRGDQPVAYGGVPLTGNVDSDNDIWAHISPREYVDIRVRRDGKEISLRLPCRGDDEAWQARVALLQAIAEGRWQACIDAISRTAETAGYFSSGMQYTALLCMREKAIAEKQRRMPDEYWPALHAWANKAIEESRYNPNGLGEVRPRLLRATEALEKTGRQTLADDIKQQISAFRQIAPVARAPGESTQARRMGTAFVVRPDGFLLTAFHVVRNAKAIEIFCPESGRASARVERFSEPNDLAVLKMAEGTKTPTYLSLAAPESFGLDERVLAIGYPARKILGGEAHVTEGVISSLSVGGNAGYMQISVPVQPGDSGGPLIASSGDVVGVTIATGSVLSFLGETGTSPLSVSWAANSAFAIPLFDSPAPSPRTTDQRALIRTALKATCSVMALSDDE